MKTVMMKMMNSYSKNIALCFITLLLSCATKAQTKSPISRLDYCYDGDDVVFTYNFKKADFDSVTFVITFSTNDDYPKDDGNSIDKTITFKKGSVEKIVLHKTSNKIRINYSVGGEEKSKKVNLLNYQCDGIRPPKKDNK